MNLPKSKRRTVEQLPDVELSVPCPWCGEEEEFFFEDDAEGFNEESDCSNCKKRVSWEGIVESVTRCTVIARPVAPSGKGTPKAGKLDTFESKDLLESSEDDLEIVEDDLEDTAIDDVK